MSVRLLIGDARAMLTTLPDASVHCVMTSPPYYGLRSYSTNPQTWGGDPACGHEWALTTERRDAGKGGNWQQAENGTGLKTGVPQTRFRGDVKAAAEPTNVVEVQQGDCTRCNAWRGELGSEPTPEQYVANLVAVFREVRRVLHPTGVLVLNLGDSYCSTAPGTRNAPMAKGSKTHPEQWANVRPETPRGMKPKDLMQMPFRVAAALRLPWLRCRDCAAEHHATAWATFPNGRRICPSCEKSRGADVSEQGWYLRSVMPWLKRAAMPESVTDRPSNALDWLFLFSKAKSYYWDAEAIRQRLSPETLLEGQWGVRQVRPAVDVHGGNQAGGVIRPNPAGRAFRNTDPWFISLDAAIADARADLARLEAMRATGGVLTGDDGLPLAVDINPAAYKEAHFATYPPALVVPFVKAGTSERGCCPRCLAPWNRSTEPTERYRAVLERQKGTEQYSTARRHQAGVIGNAISGIENARKETVTLGWAPSCACSAGDPQPCVVLDCFAGSGTTLLVADRLGRDAIGIELSEAYAELARTRLAGDAPLWTDVVDGEADGYAPLALFEEMAI